MKMLRGISSCLWGTGISIKRRFPPQPGIRHSTAFNLLRNDHFSSVEGVDKPEGESYEQLKAWHIVDQSFAATYYAADGRQFQFATVVVKEMTKETPSLQIWEHARTLIGGNPVTLAVAFVSKPSESALRTVRAFADQLAAAANHHKDETKDKEEVSSSAAHPPPQQNVTREAHNVPLIGYVVEDLGGEFESKENAGRRTLQGIPRRSIISGVSRSGSEQQQPEVRSANAAGGGGGGPVLVASSPAAAHTPPLLNFNKILVEDEDGEAGTLSDWENLWSECGQELAKVLGDPKGAADSEEEEEDEAAEDWKNGPKDEKVSKESLVSFLNALVSLRNPNAESGGGSGLIGALKRAEQKSRVQNSGMKDMGVDREASLGVGVGTGDGLARELEQFSDGTRAVPVVQRNVHASRHGSSLHQSDMLFGHVDSTITVGDNEKMGFSHPLVRREDANYKLVLCVGHMPGAKAVSFHSSTTGLPRLPDLQNAITENNPHMLLLGAPGFVFPDFIQRLATIFPSSCRAGAFLSPLFTSKQNHWKGVASDAPGPLLFGHQHSASGVVGLAVSSKDKESRVPVGAFAEFARMSIGMPRISGYIFLDEDISKCLFLPQKVSLQNSVGSPKGSMVAPSSVLEQLRRQLQQGPISLIRKISEANRRADVAEEPLVMDGSFSYSSSSSQPFIPAVPGKEELRSLERLPLALFDAVLFPGCAMPFYIYEPCYRLMVRQCLEEGKPFGLSSTYSDSWASEAVESGEVIGTIANLKVHTFERDCRSYVIAHGVRRFRVMSERIWSEPGSFGLSMGKVQLFDDKEYESAAEKGELLDLAKQAVSLCRAVMPEAQLVPGFLKSMLDPRKASFAIGHVLDVPTRVKRRWLKLVSTRTRLSEQITFLETKTPDRKPKL